MPRLGSSKREGYRAGQADRDTGPLAVREYGQLQCFNPLLRFHTPSPLRGTPPTLEGELKTTLEEELRTPEGALLTLFINPEPTSFSELSIYKFTNLQILNLKKFVTHKSFFHYE